MNLNRRVPNGLPGGVRGRKFYYFLLLDSFLENLHGGNMPGLNLSTKWFVIYKVKVWLDMEEYNLEVTELS